MELMIGRTYKVLYRNYKGEVRWRDVKVLAFSFKVCTWHSEKPALYLTVLDNEREVIREFNPSDVLDVQYVQNRWKGFWDKQPEVV